MLLLLWLDLRYGSLSGVAFDLDLLQGACHLYGGVESSWWRFHKFITDYWFKIGDEQLNAEVVEGRLSNFVCRGLQCGGLVSGVHSCPAGQAGDIGMPYNSVWHAAGSWHQLFDVLNDDGHA